MPRDANLSDSYTSDRCRFLVRLEAVMKRFYSGEEKTAGYNAPIKPLSL